MNKLDIASIATAFALAFSAGAIAQSMSKADYTSAKDSIAAEYKSANKACGSMSGNTKDICVAEAKGKEKVAKADLEARYTPSNNNNYAVSIARADADYSVAREKCDDKAGDAKTVCVKDAKAAQSKATADAKAEMKTAKAASKPAKEASTAPMSRKEGAKESVEASVITAKVQAAAPKEPSLKSAAINVETNKGIGKAVYEKSCKGCHAAMKPKTGDKEAWAPLIKQGADALTASVIKGKGIMPPKGTAASDADVKAAVEYILSQSK
jgi:cytochrome c5